MDELVDTSSVRMSLLSNQNADLEASDKNIQKNLSVEYDQPPSPTNVREFLATNKTFYRYACITGVIWPTKTDNSESSWTKHNMRYRIWAYYLNIVLFISTVLFIGLGLNQLILVGGNIAIIFCESVGIVLQNVLIYPMVLYLRKEMVNKREIDYAVYTEAFTHAHLIGRRVFIALMILLIIYSAMVVNTVVSSSQFTALSLAAMIMFLALLAPTQFFLCGILTFLVAEQRISMITMKSLSKQVNEQTLTRAQYFEGRESIDARDRKTPINLLIASTVINFILGLTLIFSLSNIHQSPWVIFVDIIFIATIFGKQLGILIIILLEIVYVNEIGDIMLKAIAKEEWSEKEQQRFALYLAVKEHPIGSTIFYIRPSKFQIMIHIGSLTISACISVFWAFLTKK